jgi:hypothetical protein
MLTKMRSEVAAKMEADSDAIRASALHQEKPCENCRDTRSTLDGYCLGCSPLLQCGTCGTLTFGPRLFCECQSVDLVAEAFAAQMLIPVC